VWACLAPAQVLGRNALIQIGVRISFAGCRTRAATKPLVSERLFYAVQDILGGQRHATGAPGTGGRA
jgi:hypothetical protein